MNKPLNNSVILAAFGFIVSIGVSAQETALDRYINKPDPNYSFNTTDKDNDFGITTVIVDMISQQWRSPNEVDRTRWQHDMVVVIPDTPFSDPERNAILLIDGGSNDGDGVDGQTLDIIRALAIATNSVAAVVKQIPNQPLRFADEVNDPRKEDQILAYSFDKFLDTGDEEWPVHLAMTKATVRAMDTVQTITDNEGVEIEGFIVLGGSKRGWTTWLTAAVDPRVKGIIPISFDALNLDVQFVHQREVYGFYARAVRDYVAFEIPCRVATPQGQELLRIVDPYEYRDRYSGLPKFVINSSGDQFFVPDSSQFYFRDLPGPKFLRYTLNTDHAQGDIEDLVLAAILWIRDVNNNDIDVPYDWTLEPDGSIRVNTFRPLAEVNLWQATNPNARDFRLEELGPAYTRSNLQDSGGGVYIGFVPPPAQGFTAFTVELVFENDVALGALEADLTYTTDMRVTPAIKPFAGIDCATAIANSGIDSVGLFDPAFSQFSLRYSNRSGGADAVIPFGPPNSNWIPVVGDWDGDDDDTIGLYDPVNARFHLRNNNAGGNADIVFDYGPPNAGWIPVAGDWDDDGNDTVGLFDPVRAMFFLRNSNTPGFADISFPYGAPDSGWQPVAGDWDGDGDDTVGLRRPDISRFYLRNSNTQGVADIAFDFGSPGAEKTPLAGFWER